MKKIFYLYSKSLLSKLALIAILIVGGGNFAWGDTVIFNGSKADGWNYKYYYQNVLSDATVTSNVLSNYSITSARYYTSNNPVTIISGQTIVLIAKLNGSNTTSYSSSSIKINFSSDNGNSWSTVKEFSYTNGDIESDYKEITFDNITPGAYTIQFEFLYSTISSITLKDAVEITTPILSITHPNDGDAFGFVTTNTTKTYTVENTGTSSMDVNITSDSEAFTVSTSSLTGITNDGTGKTFNVTFNYNADAPQPHNANITITPTFEGAVPEVINVTAGPEVEINEDKETTLSYGSGKTVFVKYIAKDGWNTICMPIPLSGSMNTLFGSGWKAYKFSSYENNTLTFTKDNYLSTTANPYLIYVENAASPANGFVIEGIMVYNKNAESVSPTGTTATFQGTYAPITAGNFTNEMYGVTSSGQVRPGDGVNANMKGYRAYFTGISAPSTPGARITLVFEDDGETTDLGFVKMVDPEATDVYTLSGQKVKKGGKGIYIVNGRKVVIK